MKKKQVVKLFSVGMACILAMSPCSAAGSIAYASETQQENETGDEESKEGEDEKDSESEEGEETEDSESIKSEDAEDSSSEESEDVEDSSSKENEGAEDLSSKVDEDIEDSSSDKSAGAETSGTEDNEEETGTPGTEKGENTEDSSSNDILENEDESTVNKQEPSQDIEDEVTTEEEETEEEVSEEIAVFTSPVEHVDLKSFYDENEISFEQSGENANWSDKGEHQMGLSSEQPLKSGATVSFDMYIPADKVNYDGLIKVQGIARLGSGWKWTQNEVIPEFGTDDFTEEVMIGDETYKKVNVSFTFGDEITADYLAEFTVKIVGYQCTYVGSVYYANVKLEDGTSQPEAGVLKTWDFADGIDGWKYDGAWDNKGTNSIEWSEQYQALAMNVDYSEDAGVSWSEIKTSFENDDFEAAGANTIAFDFIYDPASMNQGSFKIKLFSNGGDKVDANASVNTDSAEDYEDGLKVVHFKMDFDSADIKKGITIGVVGCETNYQGVIYLDDITLLTEAKQPEEDIYVDATEDVTGQNMQLSVQGNTLSTGAGNTSIATEIRLADGNADDSAKQVYAYLQAVGNTDSVIFGQQNNTSHKAGNSSLSCSDTMDVVGSYAGVIGLDGLALVGNEYSADRYLNEMQSLDSAYSTVSGQINAASTQAEKNVIAAAALTNYNIRSGAIATLSLHMPNFSVVSQTGTTGGPSYAAYDFSGYTPNTLTGDVMNQILPGGAYNAAFTAYLDMVADYAHRVDGAVLFRPFHENTGSWFWWGAAFCDEQTYKSVLNTQLNI